MRRAGGRICSRDMAVHDGGRAAQSGRMRRLHELEPLRRVDLVGADDGSHLVIEDLGGRPRQRAEPCRAQHGEKLADADADRARSLPDLEGENA